MKKWIRGFLCFAVMMALLTAMPQALAAEPEESSNLLGHDYVNGGRWTMPSFSALIYDEAAGVYTRVEYLETYVLAERYDSQLQLLDAKHLEMELPLYGGFYSGKDANFLVFGQTNVEENDEKEVIRVVKFDKNWNRLSHASLCGANTTVPFDAGRVDCAEYNGYLYLRTSHEMYTTEDGLNHQANLTMNIRIADMVITDSLYAVLNKNYGYVSHSFNQFIAIDEANKTIVGLDHGDAHPRSVVLTKYFAPAGQDKFTDPVKVPAPEYGPGYFTWVVAETADILPIASSDYYHYNDTGVSVGGLEISDSAYLTVGTSVDQDPSVYSPYAQRNVYLTVTQKDLSETKVIWLTDYDSNADVRVSNPFVVRISGDRFMIIWSTQGDENTMAHVLVDGKGALVSQVQEETIDEYSYLSDCQPIVADGKIIWYATDWSAPAFYTIDLEAGNLKPSVPDEEITQPTEPEETQPQPTEPEEEPTVPDEEVPEPSVPDEEEADPANPFVDVQAGKFYYEPVLWAVENGITKGVDDTHFGPGDGCSRGHVVTFLWRAAGCPEPESQVNPFTDVVEGKFYYKAVLWAVEKGITNGVSATEFAPNKTCTRGQIVTFLWRYADQPQADSTGIAFADVKQDAFYTDAVAWAVQAGVTNGVGNGKFAPNDTCTRGQVVTFLQRTVE